MKSTLKRKVKVFISYLGIFLINKGEVKKRFAVLIIYLFLHSGQ